MLSAIYEMCVLLLVTVAGYIAGKLGYLDAHTRSQLSKLLINVTMPLLIVSSVSGMDLASVGSQVLPAFVFGVALAVVFIALGAVCALICGYRGQELRVCVFCSLFSNIGFIGMAVAQALFGGPAVLYVSIFMLTGNVFIYSVGITVLGGRITGPIDVLRSCVNAPMVGCLAAIILLFSGVQLPGVIADAFSMIGRVTAPLAMMVVGGIVAESSLKTVLSQWRIYPLSLLRQLAFPLVIWLALRGLGFDATLFATFIVMFGLPVGAMASSMCEMFRADGTLAAQYTVISTIVSFATIPVLMAVV